MIEIGFVLIKTLTAFMFEQYLYSTVEYDIDNAPPWFYQEQASEMCSFTYEYGNLESIKKAKISAHKEMQEKINKLVDISIYEQYKNRLSADETKILKHFAKDSNLPVFVDSKLQYVKVKYEDNVNMTFVKACIPKQTIISYQTDRFKNVQKELQMYRSDKAIDGLDKEFIDSSEDDKMFN